VGDREGTDRGDGDAVTGARFGVEPAADPTVRLRLPDGVAPRWRPAWRPHVRPGELGFAMLALPTAVLGVAYVTAVTYVGGLLALTLVGLPVLAAGLRGARGLAGTHRAMVRALLGEDVAAPARLPRTSGPVAWVRASLTDLAGWRSMLYLLVRLPAAVLSLVAVLGLPALGVWLVGFDAWVLVAAPADRLAVWLTVTAIPIGVLALLATPVAIRGTSAVHRYLARALLGPTRLQRRVDLLERVSGTVVAENTRSLRQLERDLHDGTQAELVTIAMTLSMTAYALESGEPELDQVRALVTRARSQADTAIAELRRLIDGIPPAALDDGLAAALPRLTGAVPVPVELVVELPDRPDPWIARIAYFCVAELLTNITKHSGATSASVEVRGKGGHVHVTVYDNGVGGARLGAGSGLSGLRERLSTVGGTLVLTSPPGGPTVVVIELPAVI
jgi:signal transduction histidine kinase